jgi:hypothetical protein
VLTRIFGTRFSAWGHAPFVAGAFVVWGFVRLGRSRIAAFEMFERALLVSILFTQVFAFIESQFAAVIGLLVDLLLLYTVRFMLEREREAELRAESAPLDREPQLLPLAPRARV